jgi:DNA-binding response OmpR family regulator
MSLLNFFHAVEERVPAPPNDAHTILRAGDFVIDMDERTATLNGRLLDLTAAEFDLLLYLIRHPKHVITPTMSLATSRGGSIDGRGNLVHVLLALRTKLEAAERGKRHIHTEPWIFYRFDPAV